MTNSEIDERILILTPTGRDAALAVQEMALGGLQAVGCSTFDDFMTKMAEGAAAAILAEEAILPDRLPPLLDILQKQPPWSDFPVILIAGGSRSAGQSLARYRLFQGLGNVTLLERPFHRETLLSAAQSALRNRRRQYEVRALLLERKQVADDLERRVAERSLTLAQTREALHQAQKLEAIGRLAGGVAHDFNNLMTGIHGLADELASRFEEGDTNRADLQEIVKAAISASALTRQLLAFGRKELINPISLDVNKIIQDMEPLLRRSLREDIQLVVHLRGGIGNIWMDRSHFEQVLLNLIMNARDAIAQAGTITIETRSIASQYTGVAPTSVTVSDTGCGMSAETVEHIFEPFYTTKPVGKGTGLGLATVYGHVKQSNGDISVTSEPGKGTVVTIVWPVTQSPTQAVTGSLPEILRGRETILLVEDEDIVRRVAALTLERQGYRVLQASSGFEALKLFDADRQIDLLLVDVIMPGMDGRQFAEHLVSLGKNPAVLYMSGHAEDVIVHKGLLDDGIAFIAKPFTSMALCQKVRDVLDHHRSRQVTVP